MKDSAQKSVKKPNILALLLGFISVSLVLSVVVLVEIDALNSRISDYYDFYDTKEEVSSTSVFPGSKILGISSAKKYGLSIFLDVFIRSVAEFWEEVLFKKSISVEKDLNVSGISNLTTILLKGTAALNNLGAINEVTKTTLEESLELTGDLSGYLNAVTLSSLGGVEIGDIEDGDGMYLGIEDGQIVSLEVSDITSSGVIDEGTWQGDKIAVGYGGTGLTSYTVGDIIYASASGTLSKLAVGASDYVLSSNGNIPEWAEPISHLGLGDSAASIDSGAFLIGVFDEFAETDATNLQAVLADFDTAITAAGTSSWVDAGTYLYATNASSAVGIEDTTGYIGLGTTNPSVQLEVVGDVAISSGYDLHIGNVGLGDSSSTTSGASIIGVFDDFANSDASVLQTVLKHFDDAITVGLGGGSSKWDDTGSLTSLINQTDNLAIGGSTPQAAFFFWESTGSLSLDNYSFYFDGANNRLGIGNSAPLYMLDVGGTAGVQALVIAGIPVTVSATELNMLDGVTSSALEINILDGALLSTAELNILNGVTVTTAEVNYLDGTTVLEGGINFGQGTFITQDITALYWDAASDYLGLGTSNPQYTLDVDGSVRISTFGAGAGDTVVISNSGVLETRIIDSRVWGTSSFVDVISPVPYYVTKLDDTNTITVSQIWDDGIYVGIGTSDPASLLDVGGTISGQALILAGTALTASANELNILDGALLSTSELNVLNGVTSSTAELNILSGVTADSSEINILNGATLSTSELNFLTGASAVSGGLVFGDGTKFTQDAPNISWDDSNNRLGVGTSAPQYTIDVNGSVRISSGSYLYFGSLTVGDTTSGLAIGGNAYVTGGGDLYIGDIGIGDSGSAAAAGASLVGVYDEFTYSSSTRVQDVLDDLDAEIAYLNSGQSGIWRDAGNLIFPSTYDQFGILDSGLVGIGLTNPLYTLDVGGTISGQGFVLAGTAVTASANELNIMDGVLASTAELNLLNGATASTSELNYLTGSGVLVGGLVFGDGTNFSQDAHNISWDDTNNRLGVGTSIPAYLLDVGGTASIQALVLNGNALLSDAGELNILDGALLSTSDLNVLNGITASTAELNILNGVTASTSEINILSGALLSTAELNILNGVTSTTAELNYLDGTSVINGGINFGQGAFITQDIDALYWDATSDYLGLGTSNPQYTLDVDGSVRISTFGVGMGDTVVISNSGVLETRNIDSRVWGASSFVDATSPLAYYVTRFVDSNTIQNSLIWDNGVFVGIGTSAPTSLLDVGGTISGQALVLAGSALTASANELNILDGALLSTSELNVLNGITSSTSELNILNGVIASSSEINILNGATLSTAELNYLAGAGIASGGLIFGDGSGFAQNAPNISWDDSNNRLGIGTSSPQYTLDVDGDIRVSSGYDLYFGSISVGDTTVGVTINGDTYITAGGDLVIGDIGIGDSGSPTTSGGYLVKLYDEFIYSDHTNVQNVLNDLDMQISVLGGGSSKWTDLGAMTTLTQQTDNLTVGGSTPQAALYFVASTGSLSLDNYAFYYNGSGRLGIGDSTPEHMLDVGGTAAVEALVIGGSALTSSASELNILDGVSVTGTELGYLSGSSVLSGGVVFGNGSGFVQNLAYIYWDNVSNYLGVGTSVPGYTLDVGGTGSLQALVLGGQAVTSDASELNILDGVIASTSELNILSGATLSTSELNILNGVTATAAELNYLDGLTVLSGGISFGQGTYLTQDVDALYWDAANNYLGLGTSDPQYTLDVGGTTSVQGLILGGTALTSSGIELNILDGVTTSASELNILSGVSVTGTELDYLSGSGVISGGVLLADGSGFTQDISKFYWDAVSDYLGLGTSNPQYTLDVAGNVGISSGNNLYFGSIAVGDTTGGITISGNAHVIGGGDLYIGDIGIGDSGSAATSGGYLMKLYDEFTYSDHTNVQDVLDDLDMQISVLGGGSSKWTDLGAMTTLTQQTDNLTVGGSTPQAALYFVSSTGSLSLDNYAFYYNGSGRLGIGDSTPEHMLDVGGTAAVEALVIGGSALTSSVAELNILDEVTASTSELNILSGATLSTSELNILNGVTSTTAELNYLDGTTVLSGGIHFGQGAYIAQDVDALYWNAVSDYLGVGTSNPQYTLDVGGTTSVQALIIGGTALTSSGVELNILDGATASTSEINILSGISVTGAELDYLSGSAVVSGGVVFADGSNFTQDVSEFYWDTVSSYLGLGTSSPSYTLDVAGDVGIVSGSSLYLGAVAVGDTTSGITIGGDTYIVGGGDLMIGDIGVGDSGSVTTSGAYLIGVFDEFTYSDHTRLQAVLNDFDAQMMLLGGGSSKWTDLGSMTTLTQQTDNLTVGGSTPQAGLYFVSSTGSLSLDNYAFYYNGSGRLGIGDSTPEHMLDVGGTAAVEALVIGGSALTSSVAELNILDGVAASTLELNILSGATLSTSELNILNGVTSTTAELNYLDGTTVLGGGLNFGQGAFITQDIDALFWDAASDYLGLGTSNPQYTLDVDGSVRISTFGAGAGNTIVLSNSGVLETRDIDSRVWGTSSLVDVTSPVTNYVARLSDVNSITISQIWDDGSYVGIGTSDPQYTLDVSGSVRVASGSSLYLGTISVGDTTSGVVIEGNTYIKDSGDLYIGDIGVGDSSSATASGAYLIGVFDEFVYSDHTRLQDILNDFDNQMGLLGGGSSKWTDLGAMTTLTQQTDNLTVGGSTPQAGLYFVSSTGSLSLDNYAFYYDGFGRLGLGDSTPGYILDVGGTAGVQALVLGDTPLTSSASELNILTGATLSTSELNMLTGATMSTAELNYLTGSTVLNGGVVFGDGSGFSQDIANIFWDDISDRLGIGTSAPGYTLDVGGTGAFQALVLDGTALTASTSELNILAGVSVTGSELDYLSGATIFSGGVLFGNGTNISQDLSYLYWDDSSKYLGVGTSLPGYTLDVGGTGAVQALVLGGIAVTSDASELNILDGATVSTLELNILSGATLSTSELNILNGVTSTTAELNYLDGTTVLSGGINFGQGAFITQDIDALFWDATSDYLGLGTSNPQYTLDVGGTASVQTLVLGGSVLTSSASELNILSGISVTGAELDYLSGSAVVRGGVVFADGNNFTQDVSEFYWDTASKYLGLGTSNPSYALDVEGDVRISSGSNLYLGSVSIGDTTSGVRIGGDTYIVGGGDLMIGDIGLSDSGSAVTSGAYLIGVYDEFTYSDHTRLQAILNDFDAQMGLLGGGSSKWTDLGSMTTLTQQTDNLTVGGSTPQAGLYFVASAGSLSLDNYAFYYNGSGRLGIGDSTPEHMLDVGGTAAVEALVIGGFALKSSIAELNILDGATLSTSELNKLTGISVTGAELDYLSGATVQQGGLVFGDGARYAQDVSDIYWDNVGKMLGIGTSAPGYTLDIGGTGAMRALVLGGQAITSSAAEINILDGVVATTSEINILNGVTSTTAELNYLDGTTVLSGGINFGQGAFITQDVDALFWDATSDYLGLGTSNPQYTLDVDGSVRVSTLGAGSGNTVVLSNSGVLETRDIDSRVWGTSALVDVASPVANYVTKLSDTNTLVIGQIWDNGSLIGIGKSNPSYLLDIAGTTATQGLVLAGTAITADAVELNIMDGVTATTSDINILSGATLSTSELNYLTGSGVVSGGLVFGDGTKFTQDAPNISWDNSTNRLGIGTSNPQYTLDINGDVAISSGSDLYLGSISIGDTTNGIAIVGSLYVSAGSDYYIGDIGIGDSGSALTSGASLIGIHDEFTYSDETVLQAVLKDLDTQLGLGASKWTDAGTYIFANNASSYFGIDDSTGYTGIGTTNPQYQLDVGGTAAVRALVLGGTGVTSSASELNILAGATLSTSELNKLTGTSVTSTELDYLFGATVIGGGILFGDGSGFTQDASNFFWNNASDYLGVGTSNPQYTLDINGDVRVASGSDLLVGSIGLGDSGSAVTSGAILIGVYDEFTYSDSTRLQDVLDDFDNQMTLLGGGSSKWTDLGAVTTLTQQTDNLTVGGSTPQAALYFVASTGSLSLDNYAFYYDGSGRLGIGDSTPEHMLDVGGTASVQALMIGGSALTSSINELNILTGATLSTSELNKLTGTLVTGTELDYLSGSTVLEGGIIFADSSGFVQDTPNIFWDDTSDRLGIGTSAPQYTLDVGGDIRVSSGSTLYLGSIGLGDTISGVSLDGSVYLTFGSDLHIGDVGIGDSSGATTSGARLIGVYDEFANSQNTRVQDVLDDLDAEISDISTGASGIWRDEGSLIFPATYSQFSILDSGLVGIGLTNPSYTLDVGGTASVQGLVLAGTAISADAAELNILDGVTASTSEINLLQGATLSTSELNYLTGSGVTVGGLVFGDGTNFTQDTVNMSWDDSANRLGIGTSSPQYTLDVSGDIRISSSNDLLIGTIGLGDSASAVTSGAYLIGVYKDFTYSDQTTVQAVLKDFDSQLGAGASKWTDAGTYIFANNASSHFGIKDSTGYTGIGTTNPQYMLDVHGDIGITSGSVVHLGAINVGDTTSGLTLSGNVYLPSGSDYHLGDIGLGDSNLATASGAYLVGVYDEFTYSSSTKLQDVLDDLDLEINNIATGASGIWIDEGTLIYPTTYNQFAIMDSGFIGVGTTSPLYTLDVGGTGSVQALVLGGQAVTSSAAEINILDGVVASTSEINILSGATLSTSELNILNGALLSTAELNYLNGTTVLSGGINFGQGTFITQDIDALFWNAFSNYLGLGTSNPQYTLDVGGTGSMQALILGGQAVKSSASELNILDGVTATTSEINKLAGVSVTGAELDYLFGSSVFSGGMVFGNGSSFAQDLANIYWNDSFDRLGVGTSAPSYTLDVGGTAGVRALVINGVGLTSSAAELNILTGATVSTAELNKLTGVSVTGAELDYLSGAGVLNGGLVFGNGSGLAQDVSQLYWDAGADRLGIGLTNPSYTLEVSGDVGVVSGNTLYLGSVGIGDTTSGIAIGGSTYITGGGDIYIGDIGLGNSGSATTSGAYLVGVYDEFTYSTSTKVQDVLDDLDNQLYQVISGQSGLWMDAGFYYYASNASSNFAIEDTTGFLGLGTTNPAYQLDVGGTAAIQAIILGSTAVTSSASELNKLTGVSVTGAELDYLSGSTVIGGGVMFANGTILTQDTPNFFWDNAADQLGIGLSNPQYTLDVGGTGALQALVLGGTPLTSSASELNILDGATLSTSELNILAGATLDTSELNTLNGILSSTSELNYLNGSSVFVGGLVYGDGTKLIQDVSKLYWDADSDRLGIGLTNPAYTLEVSGNVGIVTGNTLYLGSIAVGDTTSGITIGGNTYITESSDLYIGDIGLGDSASAATSGAYLIGVYDEFTYSNNTRAQDVLDDLDTQLYQLTSGLTGLWMDAGVYYYASNAESTFGIEDTTGFLGLGTTNPAYQLDVGGTASVQALILGGTGVTASASELNIMDGITATTSELNKLTGVSVSGTELDYLSGSSVFSGGIVFADGTKLTQDMDNLYWDSSNNFLGIGFTSPSYNLDVAGTINTINLHINSVTVTSTAAEINKLTGVSVTSTELDYLNGSAILAGGILFADGGKFTQDINDLYWDQTNNFFGIGLTDPSYNLDVAGTINTTNLHINSVAVTSSAAELNYLDNTTILSGGIIFADGDKLAQDINYLFWDATNKFLGLGLTNPGYNLDVGGSINTTDLFVNNIGVGGSDSATTSGAFLVGVFDEFDTSDSTRLQAVLNDFDSDIYDLSTGMAGIWRDAGSYIYPINASAVLGIKDSTGFLGVGTTNPQYNLDVGGSINTTNLFLSGDIISSAATPSITISDGEIFTVADAATPDTFTINTNGSLMSFSDGSNSFTFDVDSGPSYAGNARPTRQVTLSPEYAGAVLTGDGGSNTGTMTTDFCENGASSDIPNTNTSVCNTSGDVHNYYSWTTAEASAQDYDIWIRWRVPDNFSAWVSNPVDVYAKRTDASNNAVTVYVYDTAGALENAGGTQVAGTSWTQTTVEATFAGTYTAGSYMTIRIVMTADTGGDSVQVGEISLDYLTSN